MSKGGRRALKTVYSMCQSSGQDGVTGTDLPSYLKKAKQKRVKYTLKSLSRKRNSGNEGQ